MRLLATTGSVYHHSDCWNQEEGYELGSAPPKNIYTNLFKACEWTPDGTSLVTSSEDDALRLFIIPPTLLDQDPNELKPFTRRFMPCPIISQAIYPLFDLGDPATTVVAISHKSAPIKLYNVLSNDSAAVLSFPFQHRDEYLPAISMAFTPSGGRLMCGSRRRIASFNVANPTEYVEAKVPHTICAIKGNSRNEVVTGSFEGIVTLYDFELRAIVNTDIKSQVLDLVWSRCENNVFAVCKDKIVKLDRQNNLSNLSEMHKQFSHQRIRGCMSPQDQLVCGSGSKLYVYDENQPQCKLEEPATVSTVAIHPKHELYVTTVGDRNNEISMINIYK